MSAFTSAYVRRGPWEMSPVLLLLLLTGLVGIVSGQEAEDDEVTDTQYDEAVTTADPPSTVLSEVDSDVGGVTIDPSLGYNNNTDSNEFELYNSTDVTSLAGEEEEEEPLSTAIILVPVVLAVVIIGMIVGGIVLSRKWNQKMTTSDGVHDSYLHASSTEKVPMPMFDDDIPSVLELEMEDMDQWVEKRA